MLGKKERKVKPFCANFWSWIFRENEFRGYILYGEECLQRTGENGSKPDLNPSCKNNGELELVKPNYSESKLLWESS
jgi:hypothetical protein